MKTSKYIVAATLCALCVPATAQETYENAKIATSDLNGTARYVGMGGAMEALGADISTISTNPAGVGLFRHSTISATGGFVAQDDATKFAGGEKVNATFDQGGFVYSRRTGRNSYLNFAFNYHRDRNFDQLLDAAGKLDNASQNKLTYEKARLGVFERPSDMTYSQIDGLYMNNLLEHTDDQGNTQYFYYPAGSYGFNSYEKGYIGNYDFNISGNINNRIFLGLTIGIQDIHYTGKSLYAENLVENEDGLGSVAISDTRRITGSGANIKFGAIFRPIADSPFRFGLYINTPTWYDLTTKNYTTMSTSADVSGTISSSNLPSGFSRESYDFKLYTPWKFGVSIGHTIGKVLALGATYEYADYGSMDSRVNDGTYYDYWGYSYDDSYSDDVMNDDMDMQLKGVSTLKLGAEYKPIPDLAVRLGYNYVSPMYSSDGFKNSSLSSLGSYYASSTAFTNWKATNRFTFGLGYTLENWNIDFAYTYGKTNGEFYPFMSYYDDSDSNEDNIAPMHKVSNKQHHCMLTLSYHF